MMKKFFEKLKEKWFWFRNPNLDYQVKCEEEKDAYRQWLKTPEAHKLLTDEEIEDCKQYLK